MLNRMVLAAAAIALSTPAMAACLEDTIGAQCDVFLDDYRADDVPVGTSMVWPDQEFLIEDFDYPGVGTGVETYVGEDVFYWDGENAHIVSDDSGAQFQIIDW